MPGPVKLMECFSFNHSMIPPAGSRNRFALAVGAATAN
jgi:hypothetical protein